MTKAQLLRFLGIATGAAFVCQGLAIAAGPDGAGRPWLLAAMWMPAIAAVISSKASRRLAFDALKQFRLSHALLGLAIGLALPLLHELGLWVTGQGVWSSSRFPLAADGRGISAVHHVGLVLGAGPQSWAQLAVNLMLTILAGSILAALIGGLGEELGWRAVLQPEATRRLGVVRGTFAVGVFWACWHLPINLAGYNDDVHPLLTSLLLFPIGVIGAAMALGWLMIRTRSVWPAALAHGAHNTLAGGLVLEPRSWAGDNLVSLAAAIIVGLVFGVLLWRRQLKIPHGFMFVEKSNT